MSLRAAAITAFLGLVLIEVSLAAGHGKCETLPSEIHVTKEDIDKSTGLSRTCEQTVKVNKCEGQCSSSIQPSALNSHGFQKECHCCRESGYQQRTITLNHCFDGDGLKLSGAAGSMQVTVNEPVDCQCYSCGNWREKKSPHPPYSSSHLNREHTVEGQRIATGIFVFDHIGWTNLWRQNLMSDVKFWRMASNFDVGRQIWQIPDIYNIKSHVIFPLLSWFNQLRLIKA